MGALAREPFPKFNGPDYIPARDHGRLMHQHDRIRQLMLDGRWRTLTEITEALGGETVAPGPSVSAQLRHLRKERFGSYQVYRRHRDGSDGLNEYQVQPPLPSGQLYLVSIVRNTAQIKQREEEKS